MPLFDTFHAYCYGTAFWYALRAAVRIVSPLTVIGWFRPPVESQLAPNGFEVYTTRTDAWGLVTIAIILCIIADAIPVNLSPATTIDSPSGGANAPSHGKVAYAKAIIWATVFHHLTTGYLAGMQYIHPDTTNGAMAVGVYGSGSLALLGVIAATIGLSAQGDAAAIKGMKKRS